MSAAELKIKIFDKLSVLNDENLLNQVNTLLKIFHNDFKSYKLNPKQMAMI